MTVRWHNCWAYHYECLFIDLLGRTFGIILALHIFIMDLIGKQSSKVMTLITCQKLNSQCNGLHKIVISRGITTAFINVFFFNHNRGSQNAGRPAPSRQLLPIQPNHE